MSDSLKGALDSAMRSLGKDWKKLKRRADANDRPRRSDVDRLRGYPPRTTVKEVAFRVMEEAYQKASGGGRYPANARQIYYAARPAILAEADTDEVDSRYFTQDLLKDYLERRRPAWDVVWDARGHITEPHTGESVGLGGIDVRDYIGRFSDGGFDEAPPFRPDPEIPTVGPLLRYGGVLFIEKEGFDPLLKAAKIAERFDLAIASTKGLPVSAFCDLLHELRSYKRRVYVVHDFDKSGFSIVATLRRGTRGSRGTGRVVDLGLRLADIEGLQTEVVHYDQRQSPASNLRYNGATRDEIALLVQEGSYIRRWSGERVELNAMTADQFVDWLERKIQGAGVSKIVPDEETLERAYRRAAYLQLLERRAMALRDEIAQREVAVPPDLAQRIADALNDVPDQSWDEAVWQAAQDDLGDSDE
jgi:hypothetical protein